MRLALLVPLEPQVLLDQPAPREQRAGRAWPDRKDQLAPRDRSGRPVHKVRQDPQDRRGRKDQLDPRERVELRKP